MAGPPDRPVTQLLRAASSGDAKAGGELLPLPGLFRAA